MEHIKKLFNQAVSRAFNSNGPIEVTRPDSQFGDFASNVALQLSKQLGKNPREIAEAIAEQLRQDSVVTHIEVAGPGFINVRVSDELLLTILKEDTPVPHGGTVVIETNNPNPFKAMHIGHAFNAIIADTIANLIEAGGADVHRVSYHGDVGAHVGKSMYSLLQFVDGDVHKLDEIPESERNSFMSRMYAQGARAYKEDASAKKAIDKLATQSFTQDDPVYKAIYETCKAWSFAQIDELVATLGNQPVEKRYLESQADSLGVQTVKQHVGDVFIESDGALVFPGEKYGSFTNVFVGRNGRGLYGARDLGLMQLKNNDFHPKKSYIVTAEEQRDYFKGVIKAAELCLPELVGTTVNIPTGTVKLTTGKMSSRSGDVIEVGWLFDQIAQAVNKHQEEASQEIITGAIRYQFLKVRVGSDVVFDVEEAANLQGNTGPYLQYAYVRATSILRKASQVEQPANLKLDDAEHQLLLKISEYNEACLRALDELMPHHITNYLYELTQAFNRFYEHSRILGDDREAVRLYLLQLYAEVLGGGLSILGIPAPEKM